MVAAAVVCVIALTWPSVDAHKSVTSKYTYAEHVFPIVRDRCGACHFPGGPAPMSLLSYKEAAPWAEAIREQLTTAAMPPWFADPTGPAVLGGHALPARDLDVLVTWAIGGTPEGDASKAPVSSAPPLVWSAGPPDRVFDLPEVTVAAGATEEIKAFTLPTGLQKDLWVRGVDLLPSERSMVRAVTVAVAGGPVLAAWLPGDVMMPAPSGAAFKVPAGATLQVAVRYKKNWQDTQVARTDRTRIGLYAAPASGSALTTLAFDDSLTLKVATRILAVRPVLTEPLAAVHVEATLPSGDKVPLLDLRSATAGWGRRYWLTQPVDLPAGAVLAIHVSGENPSTELLTLER